jgi:hypothetical protein
MDTTQKNKKLRTKKKLEIKFKEAKIMKIKTMIKQKKMDSKKHLRHKEKRKLLLIKKKNGELK